MKWMKNLLSFRFFAIVFACFFFLTPQNVQAKKFVFPDFDESLTRYGQSQLRYERLYTQETKDPKLLDFRKNKNEFRKIYNINRLKFTKDKKTPTRIPKIIHQIWLGSKVPEKFKDWMNSWASIQGWEYKLWTDKEVEKFPMHNRALYEKAKDYGEKSDILRYEILYNEGGLYVDVDFESIKPRLLEHLNKSYDFYAGFEPIEHRQNISSPLLGNAILAAVPGHPILQKLILEMKDYYKEHSHQWAVVCTGPVYLTEKVIQYNQIPDQKYINIFLPPTFFFPLTHSDVRKNLEENLKNLIKKETAALHLWSGSWIKDKKKLIK